MELRLRRLGHPHSHPPQLLLLPLLLLLTSRCCLSQPSPNNVPSSYYGGSVSPSMAIILVFLVTFIFIVAFFFIYINQCNGGGGGGGHAGDLAGRSRRQQRGLDPAVLEKLPTMMYSEVKEHKVSKGALECAVCLSEFENDEALRLLPLCSHVFHTECIDTWLSSHVTCPVCRFNLSLIPADGDLGPSPSSSAAAGGRDPSNRRADEPAPTNWEAEEGRVAAPPSPPPDSTVVIDVRDEEEEKMELQRIGTQRRAMRAKSSRRPARFPRSHSTGHSLAAARPGEGLERYTLRLPEHVLREIITAGKLKRSRSLVAFTAAGEGSTRPGYRGTGEGSTRPGYLGAGEGSSRGGRILRWPLFFSRTISAKFPSWATGWRGDGEGSMRGSMRGSVRKVEGEGSTKGKLGR